MQQPGRNVAQHSRKSPQKPIAGDTLTGLDRLKYPTRLMDIKSATSYT